MKKIFALVLVVSFVLPLCSCVNSGAGSTAPAGTTQEQMPATETQESTPTPTPTPTPEPPPTTPEGFYEYYSNYNLSTEEDINVLPVGKYKITFSDGSVLSYTDTGLSVNGENTDFSIQFQNSGKDSKGAADMIVPGDSMDRCVALSGSAVGNGSINYRSNNHIWKIEQKDDGTYRIVSKVGASKVLSLSPEGNIEARKAGMPEYDCKITLTRISEGHKVWDQYISEKGNIILRLKKTTYTASMLTKERVAKLTNDMQNLYDTYQDLTGYTPYESIQIQIYQTEKYFAYVVGGWNIISFNYGNAIDDLKKLALRGSKEYANDWNFCLMHEMGHMFDLEQGWKFDTESATNIKVAYALWANLDKKAVAAQSGYAFTDYFDGNTISETWKAESPIVLGDGKTLGDKVVRTCYIFSTYALNVVGWEAVREAYREIHSLKDQPKNKSEMLALFTDTMAKHGGKHIKEYIGEKEWLALVGKCDGKK